jgi:endonuclease G
MGGSSRCPHAATVALPITIGAPKMTINYLCRATGVTFVSLVFCITAWSQVLVLGNPSDAVTDTDQPANFLVVHSGFILSYNQGRGAPNWVTWHLSASDLGPVDRTDSFRTDSKLPLSWRIKHADYTNSGYNRGHMCPSEDRSNTIAANRQTFLMTNMQPQIARLNSGTWRSLEGYTQNLVRQGLEAYVTSGCYGDNGSLSNLNKVTIPTRCWKIVLFLLEGNNDLQRIDSSTRVIAVDMPNEISILSGWRNYRLTVDEIEEVTGYNFFNTLSDEIESALESRIDAQ